VVRAAGFTLVEVVVALVVLELGLLGVVGSFVLAGQTLTRAEALERGVAEVHALYDSLSLGASAGADEREVGRAWLVWEVGAGGELAIRYELPRDSVLIRLEGRVPVGTGPR
jgi:Tfp pilus assembly protein PilV